MEVNRGKDRKHHPKPGLNTHMKRAEENSWSKEKERVMSRKKLDILKKGQLAMLKSYLSCSICSEVFIKPVKLPCTHVFCKTCILQWERNQMDCPICRVKYKTLSPEDTHIAGCIKKLIGFSYTDDEKKQRDELVKSRADIEKQFLSPKFESTQTHGLSGINSGRQDQEQVNIDFSQQTHMFFSDFQKG